MRAMPGALADLRSGLSERAAGAPESGVWRERSGGRELVVGLRGRAWLRVGAGRLFGWRHTEWGEWRWQGHHLDGSAFAIGESPSSSYATAWSPRAVCTWSLSRAMAATSKLPCRSCTSLHRGRRSA